MKTVLGFLALAGTASTVLADVPLPVPSNQRMIDASQISASPIGSEQTAAGPIKYSSIPGPYFAYGVGAFAQRDDYTSTSVGNMSLDTMKFVGGVAAVGGILDFFLLDVTGTTVISSFGVSFGTAGDFIWTVSGLGGLPADQVGQLQIQNRTGTTGRWFMTSTAPSVGSNNSASGHGSEIPGGYGTFEFQVPTPGAMALLGLGGLMAARRRR